jgi:cytochrome P450
LAADLLTFLLELSRTGGAVIRYGGATEPSYLINDPAAVKHVLVDNAANYTKETALNRMFKNAVGDGILTSEGAVWSAQRSILGAQLSRHQVAAASDSILAATARLLTRWEAASATATPVDVSREMSTLTLDIVLRTLFGATMDEDLRPVAEAIAGAADLLATPGDSRFVATRRLIDAFAGRVVERARGGGSTVLDALAETADAADERSSEQILRDHVVTLILAGSETTANTLTWTWYLLALHPDVGAALVRELREVLRGESPSIERLARLTWTRRVFLEALRLYPSAWILGRRALEPDVVAGHELPGNAVLALSPYTMHRRPELWDRPEEFLPDRFRGSADDRPPFAFMPFGGGPRRCVGHNLATIEGPLVVAAVAQSFSLRLAVTPPVEPEALFVLRPRGGMPMVVRRASA